MTFPHDFVKTKQKLDSSDCSINLREAACPAIPQTRCADYSTTRQPRREPVNELKRCRPQPKVATFLRTGLLLKKPHKGILPEREAKTNTKFVPEPPKSLKNRKLAVTRTRRSNTEPSHRPGSLRALVGIEEHYSVKDAWISQGASGGRLGIPKPGAGDFWRPTSNSQPPSGSSLLTSGSAVTCYDKSNHNFFRIPNTVPECSSC